MATQTQKVEKIKEEVTPKIEKVEKKDLSGFKPKDEIFNKEKSVIDKKTGAVTQIPADWRKLHIGGSDVILKKGVELSKKQLSQFDKDATGYYLQEI